MSSRRDFYSHLASQMSISKVFDHIASIHEFHFIDRRNTYFETMIPKVETVL